MRGPRSENGPSRVLWSGRHADRVRPRLEEDVMRRSFSRVLVLGVALAGCARADRPFLYDTQSGGPVMEAAIPTDGAACTARELRLTAGQTLSRVEVCDAGRCTPIDATRLTFRGRAGRVVPVGQLRLGGGNVSEGPVIPVEGPDGLLWLCREDDEAQQCICIPWFQD